MEQAAWILEKELNQGTDFVKKEVFIRPPTKSNNSFRIRINMQKSTEIQGIYT